MALRVIGLSWGLPYDLHPDEPVILEVVEQMGWGNLNPGFFAYPGFFIYQVFLASRVVFALGGEYQHLLYVARGLTAAYGFATVWFVYLLGARLGGRHLGTIAAGLVALTGALTLHAHYAVTDTPATALATAVLWMSVRGWQRRSRAELAAAAAIAGLAVSTKYSMAPVCIVPWFGYMALASRDRASLTQRAAATALLAGVAVATFLLTSPYTLLDYQSFARDIRAESRLQAEARAGEHDDPLEDPSVADRGLIGNAVASYDDMGPAVLVMALGAGGVLVAGGRAVRDRLAVDRVAGVMVVGWVVVYFAFMAYSAKFGSRYALPLYPALMLLAAVPIAATLSAGRPGHRPRAKLLAGCLLVVAAAHPAADAIRSTHLLAQRDSRLLARDWIIENLEPGSRLAREFYAPLFNDADGFRLMQPFTLTDHSLETYCTDGVDYLILSSLNAERFFSGDEARFANQRGWYDRLDRRTQVVHRVEGVGDLELHHPTIEVRRLYCGTGR